MKAMKDKSSPLALFSSEAHEKTMEESNNKDVASSSNLAAQQAAAEAISISRASLVTTLAQGEQLHHCNDLRLRNEYIMKKSERLIRGLTWSGWMKNLITKDIDPPATSTSAMRNGHGGMNNDNYLRASGSTSRSYQTEYDDEDEPFKDVPTQLLNEASLVTNYNSNVLLLRECQSINHYEACLDICNKLQNVAQQSLQKFQWEISIEEVGGRVGVGDEERQNLLQWEKKLLSKFQKSQKLQSSLYEELQSKFYAKKSFSTATPSTSNYYQSSFPTDLSNSGSGEMVQSKYQEQEEHLNILSSNVQELLHNSTSMSMTIDEQNSILDVLNDGTDDLVESTKMVSRKADRIRYRSMWRFPKADYKCSVLVQHVPTQKYLTIEPNNNNKIALRAQANPESSVFEVHERRTPTTANTENNRVLKMIGLCNKCTRTWMGQSSFLGSVVCTAKKFGKNEEWELDDGVMERTKILCAAANWGNGGWLNVDDETGEKFSFGGYEAASKRNASLWSVIVLDS